MTAANYPLSEKSADKLQSPTGKKFTDMTKAGLLAGNVTSDDMRISPETLEMQAQVAESVGRGAFANNMRRAAELIAVGDGSLRYTTHSVPTVRRRPSCLPSPRNLRRNTTRRYPADL